MIFSGLGNGPSRLLAAVFILFAAEVSLYGGGRRESALTQVDRLIAEREHDEAILLLASYMRENPDRFTEGQQRMRRIVQTREMYNQLIHMLLDTVQTEPENDQRILELSNMLLVIESPSDIDVQQFLAQIRYLAEFNYNRSRLEHIFLAAREQLRQNDFSGALATYASGLDIFRDEFFAAGYGQEAELIASDGLQRISRNIRDFNALMGPFSQAARQLAAMDAPSLPNPDDLWAAYLRLPPLMEELAALREDFFRIRESFDQQLAILQEEQDVLGDRSFLSFVSWLISGPVGQQEGMSGTLEQFWHSMIDPAEAAIANIVSRSYRFGNAAMANLNFEESLSAFGITARYITTAQELLRYANSFFLRGGSPGYLIRGETISAEKAGPFLAFHSMVDSLAILQQAGTIGLRGDAVASRALPSLVPWQAGELSAVQAISAEQESRASFQELLGGLRAAYARAGAGLEDVLRYEEMLAELPGSPHAYFAEAQRLIITLSGHIGMQDYRSAVRKYTIANEDLAGRLPDLERTFAEGNMLISGVERWREGFGMHTLRFPSEGMETLSLMSGPLEADIAIAAELLESYAAEDSSILARAEIHALHLSARNLHSRLLSLRSRSAAAIASAGVQAERAHALRVDGDRLFQAAQAALARNDFDSARGNLVRAIDQYDVSLATQESAELRAFRDTAVVNFGTEIVRVENEIVVRDVRDMVTAARASYFAGNMEQAESLLVSAQNRWRLTNVTEQPEVEHWLRLVRGALSLNMARNISPTAPLFAEMSQLLSTASRSYNEGVSLMDAGQRQAGLARFNEALDKTREVRLMFPMNHDARMLELRIEQHTDTAAFNARFQSRLNAAVAGVGARELESFADLQDLAEINPHFPGIQAMLTQAEISMGFRPAPPNPANIARSAELTGTAEAHIISRDPVLLGVAETQLEEAIRLNPNNTHAQNLMDQLNVLLTGTGTFVLSSHAQTQYNIALQEFLRGNHLMANAIVQQLLQDPESQRSTLVQDLRRRIDAFL